MKYSIIAENEEYTVVSEYETVYGAPDQYQSEAALEKDFINTLTEQGYEYLPIHEEKDLVDNLRKQLERLNNYTFSDDEWERFFNESIANKNDGIEAKTSKIQEDHIQVLKRDNGLPAGRQGESKNIYLIDKKNIHNNYLQVINQFEMNAECRIKNVELRNR